ncbi:MAG: serine hydrolase domain-containing protein [Promethearchaeota archaeon]
MFQAASTSKLITVVTTLHHVEKGDLNLDEDVNNYLKSWKIPINNFTRTKNVTLRHLLSHQSGIPSTNFSWDEKIGDPTLAQVLDGISPALNSPAIVDSIPGSKWEYSNLGFVVIQQILEDILGKPFTQITQKTVFAPLGMDSSTFKYPLKPEFQNIEIMPHDEEGVVQNPVLHPTASAQGGLMTTPSDLALFTIELMKTYQGLSERILTQKMVKLLFQKVVDLDPNMMGLPLEGGLGVFLYDSNMDNDSFLFAHPGSNMPEATCWLYGYSKTGKGAVIMTNGIKGDILSIELISAIIKEYS